MKFISISPRPEGEGLGDLELCFSRRVGQNYGSRNGLGLYHLYFESALHIRTAFSTNMAKEIPFSSQESGPLKVLIDPSKDASLFLANELRTPLSSIRGALELIDTGHFGVLSDEGTELLDAAIRSAKRLVRLAHAIEQQPETVQSLLSVDEMGGLQAEHEFTSAFNPENCDLWYQPIVSMPTQQVIGFEALARWNHPSKGWVPPNIFIPLAEKTGLIHPLGLILLKQACCDLKAWQQAFPEVTPLTVSVNLSTVQLKDPGLFDKICAILAEVDLKPESLKLEITESTFIEDDDLAQDTLQQLQDFGIQLYLDDFGIGYSSLARLHDLPLNALKIDRAFILTKNWPLTEAVINLATQLGLDVIAEGIETVEDLEALKAIGCQKMQGYLFSKPVPAKVASNLLSQAIDTLKQVCPELEHPPQPTVLPLERVE